MKNYAAYYIEMILDRIDHKKNLLFELCCFLYKHMEARFLFGPGSDISDEFFVFMDRLLVREFFTLLGKVDGELKVINVSDSLITGDFRNEIYDQVFSEEENKEVLNRYRESNLTKDIVLDMVLERGMHVLT